MQILITGGLGYIGSHIAFDLLNCIPDCQVVVVDKTELNGTLFSTEFVNYINKRLFIHNIDLIKDACKLESEISKYNITHVIHCAALKSVPESVQNPLLYYDFNMTMTLNLLKWMTANRIFKLLYSSSATLYGNVCHSNFKEDDITFPSNPYGNTKMMCEKLLCDISKTNDSWKIICLRYFNPAGSYFDVKQGNTNLFTAVENIITNNKNNKNNVQTLTIHGFDYDTPDGTCIRDYIHISDLTNGHILALKFIESGGEKGEKCQKFDIFNLGSEAGFSTLNVAAEIAEECKIYDVHFPFVLAKRRDGDADKLVSNCQKAKNMLNWIAKKTLTDICKNVVQRCTQ